MSERPRRAERSILLIDKQDSWRERSARALTRAGFAVETLDRYSLPPDLLRGERPGPTLMVLGCASVGSEELELIGQILRHRWHLLVLSTSLPWHTMRALFRDGADDVTDKPYDADLLVTTVNQALESIYDGGAPT